MTVRRLFFVLLLGLVGCLVAGQAFLTNRGFRTELQEAGREELLGDLELAALHLQAVPDEDPAAVMEDLVQRLGFPVRLLSLEGQVLAEASGVLFPDPGPSIPQDTPEIREALSSGVGLHHRLGDEGGEDTLFGAIQLRIGGLDRVLHMAKPLPELEGVVRRRTWQALSLALPGVLLALVLTSILGRTLVRPLEFITRRVLSVSAGNFTRRLPTSIATQELGELAEAVNRITEELGRRIPVLESERDEIQALIDCLGEGVVALAEDGRVLRANQAAINLLGLPSPVPVEAAGTLVAHPGFQALMDDVGARPFPAREVDLGDQNLMVSARATEAGGVVMTFVDVTEIRRLETVRRDFVANASHELKTPLTAMRGFAETLMEDGVPEELQKKWLRSIRSHTLRLQRLVDDLLDLSRLESGGWVAKKEIVDVTVLAEDVLSDFEGMASERNVSLITQGAALALADEQGLEQVLKNLVENAIRYTADGGEINLSLEEDGDAVAVEVKDTGNGIPASALPRIFERFYRVDPARSREGGGTGLGLAIVRHLAHAMDGDVWAESEVGKGTTIFLRIPRAMTGGEGSGSGLLESSGETP